MISPPPPRLSLNLKLPLRRRCRSTASFSVSAEVKRGQQLQSAAALADFVCAYKLTHPQHGLEPLPNFFAGLSGGGGGPLQEE